MAMLWGGISAKARGIGRAAMSPFRWGKATATTAGGVVSRAVGVVQEAGKFAFGPAIWGVAAGGKSKSLLGAIGRRAVGPGIVLGGFGLALASRSLTGGAYSMEGPNVAWGHTPGMSTPYGFETMGFGSDNRFTQNMGASGALAFAMHNSRKG